MNALPPELVRLLAPQERFEALRKATLRQRGRDVVDLAYANPRSGPPAEVRAALRAALDSDRELDFQYTPYGGGTITRRLVAEQLSAAVGETFHWRDVVLTPGAMAALCILFRTLRTDGRDEVVVITPCWMDYPLYLVNLGLTPVLVEARPDDFHLDLDAIRTALTPSTRAVVLSQPNNPAGVLYHDAELAELARILTAAPSPPLLVSDECHRAFVLDDSVFCSPVRHYDRTCIVHSFGKALHVQGQRIGYAAVSPRVPEHAALAELLERTCRMTGICTPTALMQLAIQRLLDVRPDVGAVAARKRRVLDELRAMGYVVPGSAATWFLYPRTPRGDDFAFAEGLAQRGLLVLPAPVFHHRGHFRLSLTADDESVEQALGILRGGLA